MKQILQNLNNGTTEAAEVPCPSLSSGQLLIRSTCSLISPGTERMLIDFGKASLIEKARQQPDKVRMVLNKIKTDGLLQTIDVVRSKLDQPVPLGYCNVGVVLEIGNNVKGFNVGDRIASNGGHAEVVNVGANLCAKIPDNVSDEAAAFVVVGAIALQGIRLANPTLGEAVVVIGLGLIGQLTVQLLRANGCRVLGVDFDQEKLAIAKSFGAEVVDLSLGEDPVRVAEIFSRGRGVDAVLITAATQSSEPIHQAALMCRKRGRIVLVGVTGLKLSRDDFFKKELTFQVSASYGPGRYDPSYEEGGHDYPVGFVRWTEQRNFEAILDMLEKGFLDTAPLISHRFAFEEFASAYDLVGGGEPSMGVLLRYPDRSEIPDTLICKKTITIPRNPIRGANNNFPNVAFIGAGNYATGILIPAFKKAGANLVNVASRSGISGIYAGKKFGFEETTTDTLRVFEDENINAVVISTRHDSHATLVLKALYAGKHVFVEKPLCLKKEELLEIDKVYETIKHSNGRTPHLMVGYNRRFSPQIQKIKALLKNTRGPKAFVMTVNAGAISRDHWIQDESTGGGRIIGEACHFIDLLLFLAASTIVNFQAITMDCESKDTISIQLEFADGSIGSIHYFSNGSKSFPKEKLEIFADGGILLLDNFRILSGYGWAGFNRMNLWRQDKGQNACVKAFISSITGDAETPIPFDEIFESTLVAIKISESVKRFD